MTRYLDWSTKKLQRHQQQIKLVLDSRATDYPREPKSTQVAVEPERYDGGSRWIVWSPTGIDKESQRYRVPVWAVVITGITMNTLDRRMDRIHVTELLPPTWEARKGSYHTDIPRAYLDDHANPWTPEEFEDMAQAVKGLRE